MARSPRKDQSISQKNDASCIGNKRGMARRAKRNSNKRDRQSLKKDLERKMSEESEEKFYKTVITVVVLSDSPFDPEDLDVVHEAITTGDCSGQWEITSQEEVSKAEMAKLLQAQGSDPSFLLGEDYESEALIDELINGQPDDAKSNSGDETVVGT